MGERDITKPLRGSLLGSWRQLSLYWLWNRRHNRGLESSDRTPSCGRCGSSHPQPEHEVGNLKNKQKNSLLESGSGPQEGSFYCYQCREQQWSFIILRSISISIILNICKILFCNNTPTIKFLLVIIISTIFKKMGYKDVVEYTCTVYLRTTSIYGPKLPC